MERTPSAGPTAPFAGALSALVPGLGQLVRGRPGDAALCLLAALWIHGFFAGLAIPDERADPVSAALFMAFGLPQGFARPLAVVFTAFGLALHAFASWDAARPAVDGAAPGELRGGPGEPRPPDNERVGEV